MRVHRAFCAIAAASFLASCGGGTIGPAALSAGPPTPSPTATASPGGAPAPGASTPAPGQLSVYPAFINIEALNTPYKLSAVEPGDTGFLYASFCGPYPCGGSTAIQPCSVIAISPASGGLQGPGPVNFTIWQTAPLQSAVGSGLAPPFECDVYVYNGFTQAGGQAIKVPVYVNII